MDRIGRYQLDEVIGQGSGGTVWRATTGSPVPRVVAVKRVPFDADAQALARWRDEVALLAALDHPHIVAVIDIVDDHGNAAIVMPLAEGGSLADLERRLGALPPGAVVAVVAPIADALASAHRQGIVHGDVKPSNILFTADGEPLLADFGVADRLSDVRRDRSVGGSLEYADPRRLETADPAPSDDVFSLALVALEALTGQRVVPSADGREAVTPVADEDGHALWQLLVRVLRPAGGGSGLSSPDLGAADLAARLRAAVAPDAVRLPRLGAGTPLDPDWPPWADARPASETERFGPRPPSPAGSTAGRGRRPLLLWTVLVVLSVLVLVVVLAVASRPRSVAAPAAGGRRRCPSLAPMPAPAGAVRLEADLTGRGCTVPVLWDRGVVEFRLSAADRAPRRYAFRPSDRGARSARSGTLLVGDWDCDGTDGLAYYDPDLGVVHYFDRLPARGALVADAEASIGPRAARLRVVRHGRCDQVVAVPWPAPAGTGHGTTHPAR